MSRKYLLDCSASGAKWADDVQGFLLIRDWRILTIYTAYKC